MKLKRIVAAMLAIIMLLALAACGDEKGQDSTDNNDDSENATEHDTILFPDEAVNIAKNYITEGQGGYDLLDKVSGRNDTTQISVPSIGSASKDFQDDTSYGVEVNGTFNGYDDYGEFTKRYRYTFEIYVDKSGTVDSDRSFIVIHSS